MKYNTAWLIQRIEAGVRPKYIYFWGHRKRGDGVITKTCLSQWYEAGFDVDGIHYPTAEHWMMAGKAKLFGDAEMLEKIHGTNNPAKAKNYGRQVKNFDVQTWREHMTEIVTEGNYHKFSQNEPLRDWLLKTGDKVLVEASPFDPYWGIGLGVEEADGLHPADWKGENWLGWCAMEARDQIRADMGK